MQVSDSRVATGTLTKSMSGGVGSRSKRRAKYGNSPTNGYASKREAARAEQLKLCEKAGLIRNLREQVEFELIPKQDGERACSYRADFVYERPIDWIDDAERTIQKWVEVVEDTKGHRTADYIIKRKLMLWRHNIKVQEI